MELTVKLVSGEGRAVQVGTGATVGELRQAVAQSFGEPVERVRLSTANATANDLRSTTLDNDSALLSGFGLSHGSALMLLLRSPAVTQVIVKNEYGQKMYDVGEEETVAQLQRKIYNKDRVPEDQQRLIFSGRQMEAGMKLKDYNVTKNSTIHQTLRLRGG